MTDDKKIKCFCCNRLYPPEEISSPDSNSIHKDKKICQECLWGVLHGEIILDL